MPKNDESSVLASSFSGVSYINSRWKFKYETKELEIDTSTLDLLHTSLLSVLTPQGGTQQAFFFGFFLEDESQLLKK